MLSRIIVDKEKERYRFSVRYKGHGARMFIYRDLETAQMEWEKCEQRILQIRKIHGILLHCPQEEALQELRNIEPSLENGEEVIFYEMQRAFYMEDVEEYLYLCDVMMERWFRIPKDILAPHLLMAEKIRNLEEKLQDTPEMLALVRLMREAELRLKEALSLKAEVFEVRRFYTPKFGPKELPLPPVSAKTEELLQLLIEDDGVIFKKEPSYYNAYIRRSLPGIRVFNIRIFCKTQKLLLEYLK